MRQCSSCRSLWTRTSAASQIVGMPQNSLENESCPIRHLSAREVAIAQSPRASRSCVPRTDSRQVLCKRFQPQTIDEREECLSSFCFYPCLHRAKLFILTSRSTQCTPYFRSNTTCVQQAIKGAELDGVGSCVSVIELHPRGRLGGQEGKHGRATRQTVCKQC